VGLANAKDAGAIFARSQLSVFTGAIKHGSQTASCSSSSGTGYEWWYCGPVGDEPVTATLIGYDATSCIAYYHLEGISCSGIIRDITQGCCGNPFPIPGTNPITSVNTGTAGTSQGVSLGDGGSTASPYDGSKHYNYSGYPVCAAFRDPAGDDHAFAAGSAAALTVSDAATACGTGSMDICADGCDDTDMIINFN